MEITVVEGLRTVKLDLVFSLALAAVVLFVGYFVQRRVRFLSRANIPAAAIGGLLFALLVLVLRARGGVAISLNTTLRAPLQTVFFTTIGLSATTGLLRAGGRRMGFFWLLATLTAIVQNLVGMALAVALGAPALLGVICGALTLTGGPATGLAWADRFEALGVTGAGSLIIASAMFGIFTASLVGNPVATALIRRFRLAPTQERRASSVAEENFWALSPTITPDEDEEPRGRAARVLDEGSAKVSEDSADDSGA
ncbi:MAG: glutamate:Na+ symporter, family, partial [Acidobacteriota bacterium]|nr:glutamate:Na+ symporter, family [Acidobacteriota bacterium]